MCNHLKFPYIYQNQCPITNASQRAHSAQPHTDAEIMTFLVLPFLDEILSNLFVYVNILAIKIQQVCSNKTLLVWSIWPNLSQTLHKTPCYGPGIEAWFTWIGEIIATRMLFNGNNNYYHYIISKTLNVFFIFPWISSPHGSLGLAHHRYAYCIWELSYANTQTLSGPLTMIRSLWGLECQMVVVAIHAPGLTPLPIAGWLALGYEALPKLTFFVLHTRITDFQTKMTHKYRTTQK